MLEVEENDHEHLFSSCHDIQIQQRLLDADDDISAKDVLNNIKRSSRQKNIVANSDAGTNSNASNLQKIRELRTSPLCGWYIDPDVVYRKTSNGGPSKSKGNSGTINKENTLSRDAKNKANPSHSFTFLHYTNIKCYIEQYRKEHICTVTVALSATRNDFWDSWRPYPCSQYPPLAVCSEINTIHENTTLPSSQHEGSAGQNIKQQYHSHNKPQQITSVQCTSKQEQKRQTIPTSLRSCKTSYSTTSTNEVNKVNILEPYQATGRPERIRSAKNTIFTRAVADTAIKKSESTVMKIHNVIPTKLLQLPGPGSPLDLNAGSQLVGHKLDSGIGSQLRMVDAFACRAGYGTEKENSGIQAIVGGSKSRLESLRPVNEQDRKPKPCQLLMTTARKGEDWPLNVFGSGDREKMPAQLSLGISKSGSDATSSDSSGSAGHSHKNQNYVCQKTVEKPQRASDKMSEQNIPLKERSLLAVTGHDCCQTRKFACDRCTIAKKQDEKSLLPHNRRIRHLIEQSKLKCRLDQIINQPKAPSGRSILELNSVQITDPFVKAIPSGDHSTSNCKQDVSDGLCSCLTGFKINDKTGSAGNVNNPLQNEISSSCAEMPEDLFLGMVEGFDCFASKVGFTRDNIDQNLFRHTQRSNHDLQAKAGQYSHEVMRDASWENGLESCLTVKDSSAQTSKNKCYVHKLVQDASAMITCSVAKHRYPKCSLVHRSHSMDL